MNVLEEANLVTHGERMNDYSPPEVNFVLISKIASSILGKEISAKECCMVMVAVKLSREAYKHKRDNLVDLAGYAWCLSRIEGDEKLELKF